MRINPWPAVVLIASFVVLPCLERAGGETGGSTGTLEFKRFDYQPSKSPLRSRNSSRPSTSIWNTEITVFASFSTWPEIVGDASWVIEAAVDDVFSQPAFLGSEYDEFRNPTLGKELVSTQRVSSHGAKATRWNLSAPNDACAEALVYAILRHYDSAPRKRCEAMVAEYKANLKTLEAEKEALLEERRKVDAEIEALELPTWNLEKLEEAISAFSVESRNNEIEIAELSGRVEASRMLTEKECSTESEPDAEPCISLRRMLAEDEVALAGKRGRETAFRERIERYKLGLEKLKDRPGTTKNYRNMAYFKSELSKVQEQLNLLTPDREIRVLNNEITLQAIGSD